MEGPDAIIFDALRGHLASLDKVEKERGKGRRYIDSISAMVSAVEEMNEVIEQETRKLLQTHLLTSTLPADQQDGLLRAWARYNSAWDDVINTKTSAEAFRAAPPGTTFEQLIHEQRRAAAATGKNWVFADAEILQERADEFWRQFTGLRENLGRPDRALDQEGKNAWEIFQLLEVIQTEEARTTSYNRAAVARRCLLLREEVVEDLLNDNTAETLWDREVPVTNAESMGSPSLSNAGAPLPRTRAQAAEAARTHEGAGNIVSGSPEAFEDMLVLARSAGQNEGGRIDRLWLTATTEVETRAMQAQRDGAITRSELNGMLATIQIESEARSGTAAFIDRDDRIESSNKIYLKMLDTMNRVFRITKTSRLRTAITTMLVLPASFLAFAFVASSVVPQLAEFLSGESIKAAIEMTASLRNAIAEGVVNPAENPGLVAMMHTPWTIFAEQANMVMSARTLLPTGGLSGEWFLLSTMHNHVALLWIYMLNVKKMMANLRQYSTLAAFLLPPTSFSGSTLGWFGRLVTAQRRISAEDRRIRGEQITLQAAGPGSWWQSAFNGISDFLYSTSQSFYSWYIMAMLASEFENASAIDFIPLVSSGIYAFSHLLPGWFYGFLSDEGLVTVISQNRAVNRTITGSLRRTAIEETPSREVGLTMPRIVALNVSVRVDETNGTGTVAYAGEEYDFELTEGLDHVYDIEISDADTVRVYHNKAEGRWVCHRYSGGMENGDSDVSAMD